MKKKFIEKMLDGRFIEVEVDVDVDVTVNELPEDFDIEEVLESDDSDDIVEVEVHEVRDESSVEEDDNSIMAAIDILEDAMMNMLEAIKLLRKEMQNGTVR